MNIWEPIRTIIPPCEEKLNKKLIKKKHYYLVEIWWNHLLVKTYKSTNKKIIQKWIKENMYDIFFRNNLCMIYILFNGKTNLNFYKFMKDKMYISIIQKN